jgi:hypothetical protein
MVRRECSIERGALGESPGARRESTIARAETTRASGVDR